MFTLEFDRLDWLSKFYSERSETTELVNFQDFSHGPVCDFGQNMIMTKSS